MGVDETEKRGEPIREPLEGVDTRWHPLSRFVCVEPRGRRDMSSARFHVAGHLKPHDTLKKLMDILDAHKRAKGKLKNTPLSEATNAEREILARHYQMPVYGCFVPPEATEMVEILVGTGEISAEALLVTNDLSLQQIGDSQSLYIRVDQNVIPHPLGQSGADRKIVVWGHEMSDPHFTPAPDSRIRFEHVDQDKTPRLDVWTVLMRHLVAGTLRSNRGEAVRTPSQVAQLAQETGTIFEPARMHDVVDTMVSTKAILAALEDGSLKAAQLGNYYKELAIYQRLIAAEGLKLAQQKTPKDSPDIFQKVLEISLHESPHVKSPQLVPFGYLVELTDAFVQSFLDKGEFMEDGKTYPIESFARQGNAFLAFIYHQLAHGLDRVSRYGMNAVDRIDSGSQVYNPLHEALSTAGPVTDAGTRIIENMQRYFRADPQDIGDMRDYMAREVESANPMSYLARDILEYVHRRLVDVARIQAFYQKNPGVLNRANPPESPRDVVVQASLQKVRDEIQRPAGRKNSSRPYNIRTHNARFQ